MQTLTFLGLDEGDLSSEKAEVLIQPIPYDSTTSFQPGTRFGPEAILQASRQVELWDEELSWEPMGQNRSLTLSDIPPNHRGPEYMVRDIQKALQPYWDQGKFILALGGEHTISLPLVRGVLERHPDLVLITFDAHGDLRDAWEGTPFSHACVLRRISELKVPVFHLGLRSLSGEEQAYLQAQDLIRAYTSREILRDNGLDRFQRELAGFSGRSFYLSLDVDVFDPGLVPGTGTPEPGGLDWFTMLQALRLVSETGPIRGADLCELMPLPGSRTSEFVAAKLIFKILSYNFYQKRSTGHV